MEKSSASSLTITDTFSTILTEMMKATQKFEKTNPEIIPLVENFVDQIGRILVDEKIATDENLIEKLRSPDLSTIFATLKSELTKSIGRNSTIRLSRRFTSNLMKNHALNTGNRFENQRMGHPLEKNHETKPSYAFVRTEDKSKGTNLGFKGQKRILEPGNADGTIGKQYKPFSKSKYSNNLHMIKMSDKENRSREELIRQFDTNKGQYSKEQLEFWNRVDSNEYYAQQNEVMISNMVGIYGGGYKIRKVADNNLHDNNRAIQVKLLKDVKSIREIYDSSIKSGSPTEDTIEVAKNINPESMLNAILLQFFLGLDDRLNPENTLIGKDKNITPIDYTRLAGPSHNERMKRFSDAIISNNIQQAKDILMEIMYEEAHHRELIDENVTHYKRSGFTLDEKAQYETKPAIQIMKLFLDNTSAEEFIEAVQNFVTLEKVTAVEEIWKNYMNKEGKEQKDPQGNHINYDIEKGLKNVAEAMRMRDRGIKRSESGRGVD